MPAPDISENDKRRVIDRLNAAMPRIAANLLRDWKHCGKAACRRARRCRGAPARVDNGCAAFDDGED
jgi:hypothetical protein